MPVRGSAHARRPLRRPGRNYQPPAPGLSRQQILWFLLPMVAAMQLTAVTGHLTQNIAAIPLLWILPLGVYLFSFIVAFEFRRLYNRGLMIRLLVVFLAASATPLADRHTLPHRLVHRLLPL